MPNVINIISDAPIRYWPIISRPLIGA